MGRIVGNSPNEPIGQPSNLYPIKVDESEALASDDPFIARQQKRGGAGEQR
jgi:hypothetical protein